MSTKALYNASNGKTLKDGGLNLSDFRKKLVKMYPNKKSIIQKKNRKELETYSKTLLDTPHNENYKKHPDTSIQGRYCRCIAKVAAKNPEWCYKHDAWKNKQRGVCSNPYPICTASTKRKGKVSCGGYYYKNLQNMPSAEVRALAAMKGTSVKEYKRLLKKENLGIK